MNRRLVVAALVALAGVVFAQCGQMTTEPALSLSARPLVIDSTGQMTTIGVTATNELGKPGTGTVSFVSEAGSLKGGTDVTLTEGAGSVTFTCNAAIDANCKNRVKVTATWAYAGKTYESTVSITVTGSSDGGAGGGGAGDGGMGGGGGGTGGGSTMVVDAGVYRISVSFGKASLVAGTGDSTLVTATVRTTDGGVAVSGESLTFTTNRGSFAAQPGSTQAGALTDSNGQATATLYAAGATTGVATVTASAQDSTTAATIAFADVSGIQYFPDSRQKQSLGIIQSGRDTMTPVFFKVLNANNMGVGGVAVSFDVSGAPGAAVSPTGISDDGGVVFTTLTSGDDIGTATVTATTQGSSGTKTAMSNTIPITGGRPSDRGFTFTCTQKNLGALHTGTTPPPTRQNTNTDCTVELKDRFQKPVGPTSVSFYVEVGSAANTPVMTPNSATNAGVAVLNYRSFSQALPYDVTPIAGEPTYAGGKNPRDMLVSIIAVVNGEEEFADGSADGGINGRWDPGEWFVDVSEPFLDENDNNVWDLGERVPLNNSNDCARPDGGLSTGWDGPNGCWDSDTQIWRITHIVLSGPLSGPMTIQGNPSFPIVVSQGQTRSFPFSMVDQWGNSASVEGQPYGATMSPMVTGATATVTTPAIGDRRGAMDVLYTTVQATESAPGSGVFTINGPCNYGVPVPGPLTRCLRRTDFGAFVPGTPGTLTLTGRAMMTLSDGGQLPAAGTDVTVTAPHSFSTATQHIVPVIFQ